MPNQENTELSEELKEKIRKLHKPNIAVIGRTGVGKSTLINKALGIEEAIAGAGLSVTKGFIRYPNSTDEICPIIVYDSAGYQAGKESDFVKNVLEFLEKKQAEGRQQKGS